MADREGGPSARFDLALPLEIVCEVFRRADFASVAAALADEVLGELLWPHALYIAPVEWADELAVHAAACGRPAELAAALARYPEARPHLCARAVAAGGLPALKLAQAAGAPWGAWSSGVPHARPADIVEAAATAGRTDVLEYLQGLGCAWNGRTMVAAVKAGWFDVVEWLRARGCAWGGWGAAMTAAIESGASLEAIRRLADAGCPWGRAPLAAAEAGREDVLRLGLDAESACKFPKPCSLLCAAAARGGRLGLLQELRDQGYAWDEYTAAAAAESGCLETLAWAADNGCPVTSTAYMYAAKGGHVRVLDWLEARGIQDDNNPEHYPTLAKAIYHAHVGVLEWLESRGLYAPAAPTAPTAPTGRLNTHYFNGVGRDIKEPEGVEQRILDCLEWMLARDFPEDNHGMVYTAQRAAALGHLRVLERVSQVWDALGDAFGTRALIEREVRSTAFVCGRYRVTAWMDDRGFSRDEHAYDDAASVGDFEELVRRMASGDAPWREPGGRFAGTSVISGAAAAGRLDILYWLIKENVHNGDASAFAPGVRRAATAGQVPAVRLLLDAGGKFLRDIVGVSLHRFVSTISLPDITALRQLVLTQSECLEGALRSAEGLATVLRWPSADLFEALDATRDEWVAFATADVAAATADCGHLGVLRWLRERGCPWDFRVIEKAENAGHTRLVEWARANGCPEPAGE